MPVYVLFVSSRSGIVFNRSAGAITDHSQSAKDIDPYFKSQLYVEDPGHRKPALILPNGLSKPGERAHDRYLISAVDGIRTDNLLIDSPACYHWAITAIVDVSQRFASTMSPDKYLSIFNLTLVRCIPWFPRVSHSIATRTENVTRCLQSIND